MTVLQVLRRRRARKDCLADPTFGTLIADVAPSAPGAPTYRTECTLRTRSTPT